MKKNLLSKKQSELMRQSHWAYMLNYLMETILNPKRGSTKGFDREAREYQVQTERQI